MLQATGVVGVDKSYFLARVQKTPGCWLWKLTPHKTGYGELGSSRSSFKRDFAHRWAFRLFKGSIPEGLCVLHKCDNRRCVNPDHLFLGTKADNNEDMHAKGRQSRGETHGDRMRGELQGSAKLTLAQAKEIILRRDAGETNGQIAEDMGVCRSTVSKVYNGSNWAHARTP